MLNNAIFKKIIRNSIQHICENYLHVPKNESRFKFVGIKLCLPSLKLFLCINTSVSHDTLLRNRHSNKKKEFGNSFYKFDAVLNKMVLVRFL